MNQRSIRRLRIRFVAFATFTYFLVMVFMGSLINLTNYYMTYSQINDILDYLVENNGYVSALEDGEKEEDFGEFTPEYRYSMRYFSVVFQEDQETVSSAQMRHIAKVSAEEGIEMASRAMRSKKEYGHVGYYYWKKQMLENKETIVVFLNCQSQVLLYTRILNLTFLIAGAGLLITFAVVAAFSNRIIEPELENMRRQKQFITNASHELKTPLAVIRANTEIEEMMNGETEWTQSTTRQIDRLNGLIQNLVMITRAQEQEDRSEMTSIDASQAVRETVEPYTSLALQEKKELLLQIQPEVQMLADGSKIRQLTSLLIDNAFKYCDEKGTVSVQFASVRKGKQVRLIVSNSYKDGANVNYSRFFDRFYREDQSHNVDRGGYGIGLSIAESLCQQYGGSITASWKDGMISFTCLLSS
ncbi:MAG: HAMP domain-containing sensor histidine kinase [Lachnospiraceae bacterium]|nr:HAMP domain-containing sensor histidine kinase [Lachnospiraceae bacterium]